MVRLFPYSCPRPLRGQSVLVPGLSRSVPLRVLLSRPSLPPLAVGPLRRALAEPEVRGTDLEVVPWPVSLCPTLVSCTRHRPGPEVGRNLPMGRGCVSGCLCPLTLSADTRVSLSAAPASPVPCHGEAVTTEASWIVLTWGKAILLFLEDCSFAYHQARECTRWVWAPFGERSEARDGGRCRASPGAFLS